MKPTKKSGFRFALVQLSIMGIAAATIYLEALATRAFAAGWSASARITERLEADDNINMKVKGARNAYGSTTTLGTNLAWKGHRRALGLNSSFDVRRFFGPGSSEELDTFNHSHTINYSIKRKTTNYNFSASYNEQDTQTSELEDTGFITQSDNTRITQSYSAKATYSINSRSTIDWLATLKMVDFAKSSISLTPFTDIDLTSTFTQKLDKRNDIIVSLSTGYYASDDLVDTTSYSYRLTGQLNSKLTRNLSTHIKAGIIAIDTSRNAGLTTPASSEFSIGDLYEIGLDYQLKTTTFSLSTSSNVSPSASDGLLRKTNVGFGISHQINHHSSIDFSANRVSSSAGTSLSIAPSYSYQFTKDWSSNLAYTYRRQDSVGSVASSNKIFLSFTKKILLLP